MGCLLACLLCLQVTADHLKNQQTKNSLGKEKYTLEKYHISKKCPFSLEKTGFLEHIHIF